MFFMIIFLIVGFDLYQFIDHIKLTMSNLETNESKEKYADLSKNKRVTVRKFKNLVLLDIREYYTDGSGALKPGKKGISLTREQWNILQENRDALEEAMDEIEEGQGPAKKTKTEKSEELHKVKDEIKDEIKAEVKEEVEKD